MRKRLGFTYIIVLIILVASVSLASAKSDDSNLQIKNSFDSLKDKLDQLNSERNDSSWVAKVNGIEIDNKRFIFYKSNIELTYSLNKNNEVVPNDIELVNNLLVDDLAIQEAINQGITVSDEEIQKEIDYQRSMVDSLNPSNIKEEQFLELIKNRIRITGLSDDEFWQSDFIKDLYRKSILGGKFMLESISNGTVKDPEEFYAYKKELFEKMKTQITYNQSNESLLLNFD